MPAELQASRQDATLILTLSNPGSADTLSAALCAAAIEVLSTAERDGTVRSVIITGAAGAFCAGSNLHQLLEHRAATASAQVPFSDHVHSLIEAIRDCPKPVIAAVEGAVAGAGLSLVLACDFLVAGEACAFAMPDVRAGLTPQGGAAWFLMQSLPRQLAAEILFTGKPVAASRLQMLGMVNRLAADGAALDIALSWAEEFTEASPAALERIKQLLNQAPVCTFDQHRDMEKQAFVESLYHHDAHEGIQALLEKRKPHYK